MNQNLNIIKDFKEQIKNLKRHNELYFNQDNPEISDSTYDNLKKKLIELENKYYFLKR